MLDHGLILLRIKINFMSKNILILGNGFIGNNLYKYFVSKYNTTITSKQDIDVTDPNSVKNYLDNKNFDYVIYAIGIKDITECERCPDKAYSINSNGVANIIQYLNKNTKFIYISTDYVFDGNAGRYSENSTPIPVTVYGKSKLMGEQYTTQHKNSIVVRTSGVYGENCLWLKNLLASLLENKKTVCFSDVYNTPTYAINLAEMIDDIININFTGIIHLSGDTRNNRYELYSAVATMFDRDATLLSSGISNGQFPKDISLNNSLYKTLIKKIPSSTINGLIRFKNEY
jgi:dTDP-4-dehydrorhamnose reductase